MEGFRVNALDYLLKPISYPDFLESASKALKWFGMAGNDAGSGSVDSLFVKTDYRLLRIGLDDILYVEGLKDYVRIWLQGCSEPVLTLMSMKVLEEQLLSSSLRRCRMSREEGSYSAR